VKKRKDKEGKNLDKMMEDEEEEEEEEENEEDGALISSSTCHEASHTIILFLRSLLSSLFFLFFSSTLSLTPPLCISTAQVHPLLPLHQPLFSCSYCHVLIVIQQARLK
jgi:hypothetical protein